MGLFDDPVGTALQKGADALTEVQPFLEKAVDGLNTITRPEVTEAQQGVRLEAKQKYGYKFIQYPDELGRGTRHPYYMTFYINRQDLSKFKTELAKDKRGNTIRSTVETNLNGTRTFLRSFGKHTLGFGRKTSRTTQGICLFLPDTLAWSYSNHFKDVSLSGLSVGGFNASRVAQGISSLDSAAKSVLEGYQKGGIAGVMSALGSGKNRGAIAPVAEFAGEALFGPEGGPLGAQALGLAVNPQIDVIYDSPELRSFTFDFLFAPRSRSEAGKVAEIIKMFKSNAAPELQGQGSGIGRYFIPPSEFDIEFSVDTMGKISTCVLQNITVDYAPSGAAFYNNDAPVYTRLTLQFKELEFITKNLIEEKGY